MGNPEYPRSQIVQSFLISLSFIQEAQKNFDTAKGQKSLNQQLCEFDKVR